MLCIELVIHLAKNLLLILVCRTAVDDATTFVLWFWQPLDQLQRHGVEGKLRCVDPVVHKSCWRTIRAVRREYGNGPAATCGRCDSREVPVQHGLRGHECLILRRIRPKRGSLKATEEEQFVFDDRSACSSTELISLERAGLLVAFCVQSGKVRSCIEEIVPKELKDIAVEGVGP